MGPLITLTTDFGQGSPYVAAMKGVLWSINPEARVVDVSHAIRPQDVREGALVLRQVAPLFPPATLHVAVVDPGVGGRRAILYAEIAGQRFIAPDNGLLSWVARDRPPEMLRRVDQPAYWRQTVSDTFHGRDIMAPLAAYLSLGVPPEAIGKPHPAMEPLPWPALLRSEGQLAGEVVYVDSFGNLITNIEASDLAGLPLPTVMVDVAGHETPGIFRTYADQPPETLIALVGSSGLLEIAITHGNAAEMLALSVAAPVRLTWQRSAEADPP